MKTKKKIGLFVLVMFIVGSIDSLRNMPAAAMFGPPLIFFFALSALTFLLPIALLSAELSSYHAEKNGIYQWVREAFGDKIGLFAIWLQWINTTIWFPTILSFIAGGIAYLINPALAQSKTFVVTTILIVFWSMALLSLKNLSISARFSAFCALFGFVLPFCVIASLLAIWLIHGNPVQIHVTAKSIFPDFSHMGNWISLTAVITAFLGMELAAVNIQDIKNPKKNYPIGVIIASCIIASTMVLGSLSIAFVIPQKQISLIAGIFEMLQYYLKHFNLVWLVGIMSILVIFSSLGEMVNWIVSPARGLQQAAQAGHLPKILAKSNANGMPAHVLILQAIIVSCICIAFTLFKTVNHIYWLLTDLSTEMYVMMYIMMFLAAIKLHYKNKNIPKSFEIPGGAISKWILGLLGLTSSTIALIVGFIPPDTLDFGGIWHYAAIFAIGLILLCTPGVLLMLKKSFN